MFPFYLPIELLPGIHQSLNLAAARCRTASEAFELAERASSRIGTIRAGDAWRGPAYEAFRDLFEARPLAGASRRGASFMDTAAASLDWLAGRHALHQRDLVILRGQLHQLTSGGTSVADDQIAEADRIVREARAVWDAHKRDEDVVRDLFNDFDDATTFATPPRSTFDQAKSFGAGVVDSLVGMGKIAILLHRLQHDPTIWLQIWNDREEIVATLDYVVHNPGDFVYALGRAVIDVDTLTENPARWLGKLAPTIVLTVLTAGGGSASKAAVALENAMPALASVPRVASAVRVVASGESLVGATVPGLVKPLEVMGSIDTWKRRYGAAQAARKTAQDDCIDDELDRLIAELSQPVP